MPSSTPYSAEHSSPDPDAVSPERLAQEWCSLHRLIQELTLVQSRLGTPLESPADYDVVQALGHQIRNKLHLVQTWQELGMIQPVLDDLLASR